MLLGSMTVLAAIFAVLTCALGHFSGAAIVFGTLGCFVGYWLGLFAIAFAVLWVSCATVDMTPSASSASVKRSEIFFWKYVEYKKTTGMNSVAANAIFPFMEYMNEREITMWKSTLNTSSSCPVTKLRTVSTSEVQRCMTSPV